MRLVFFGSGAFGLPTLEALAREHEVLAVVTQPDKPAGRKRLMTPTPIGAWAAEHLPGVPLEKPETVNTPERVAQLRGLEADAWVVIAFGQKLGPELLKGVFAINLHASLLPRWRGAAPIHRAIEAGDEITGNSVITLADRMDAGLVLGTSERPVTPDVTTGEMHDLLAADGPELVLHVLDRHATGTLEPITQDEGGVTLAKKMTKAEGTVDFTLSARMTRCKVHGFTPWPGVTVDYQGEALKLLRVRARTEPADGAPGTIVDADAGIVSCGGGTTLELVEVQPAGKRPMAWAEFARGRDVVEGALLRGVGAT